MLIKKLAGMVLVLSFSTVFAACGDDDDDSVDIEASCQTYCSKVAPLNCPGTPAATCVADCKEEAEEIPVPEKCRDAVKTAAECLDALPVSDYECSALEDDEATPKEGACEAEQTSALLCVLAG